VFVATQGKAGDVSTPEAGSVQDVAGPPAPGRRARNDRPRVPRSSPGDACPSASEVYSLVTLMALGPLGPASSS
jgi:hypothetical protein